MTRVDLFELGQRGVCFAQDHRMSFITVGKENSTDINLYYEDHGQGQPVVLIHGYPQSGAAWEQQLQPLLDASHRVITYDRRGFGKSSQPVVGYDYETFAADLDCLINKLDLRDAVLVGHSMGSGEICRYLSRFGTERVAKCVLISALQPCLLKSEINPDGVDASVFETFQASARTDRFKFLRTFFDAFFSSGMLSNNGVSDECFEHCIEVGAFASPKAIHDCIETWKTDFTGDLSAITIPTLILHGTSDKVVAFEATAPKIQQAIPGSVLIPIDGAPHSLPWTHATDVNREILAFLAGEVSERAVA
jgi:non-heme chloroperoxidase